MRKFVLILILLLVPSICFATNYYVDKTLGSDSNDGLAPTDEGGGVGPWETLSKVNTIGNTTEYSSDDNIYLKCGETWDEQLIMYGTGTSGHPVTYSSYGTGTNPTITQLYHRNANHGVVTGLNEYIVIENIRITNDGGDGISVKTISHIEFDNLYVYSCSGDGMEFGPTEDFGIEDWTISNTTFINNGANGALIYDAVNGLTISDSIFDNNTNDGITLKSSADNGVVLNDCISRNNTEDGFDIAGTAGSVIYNRCLAYDNGSAGFSAKATNAASTAIYRYSMSWGNNEGFDIGNSQTSTMYNCIAYSNDFIGIWHQDGNTSTHTVKNCLLYSNGENPAASGEQISWHAAGQTTVSDYNLITEHSLGRTIYDHQDSTMRTLAGWKAEEAGNDQNSIGTTPTFVNVSAGTAAGFCPTSISPVIDAGTDVSLTTDYYGETVPFDGTASQPGGADTEDIGAIEYSYSSIVTSNGTTTEIDAASDFENYTTGVLITGDNGIVNLYGTGSYANADGIPIEIDDDADATTVLLRTWADYDYVLDNGTSTVFVNKGGAGAM